MRRILHIMGRRDDALAADVIETQRANKDNEVIVVDLTRDEVDYEKLLEEIFAADSVESW